MKIKRAIVIGDLPVLCPDCQFANYDFGVCDLTGDDLDGRCSTRLDTCPLEVEEEKATSYNSKESATSDPPSDAYSSAGKTKVILSATERGNP
jgi:hypothetical protein